MMKLPDFITKLLHHLESHGFQSFVVGGCVRNTLLGLSPDDWDICTQATPEEMLRVFQDYKVIPTGIAHGTVTVLAHGKQAEITTFRTEGSYLDHRHPESVSFVSSVQKDLARRDFTVNAMAYSPIHGLVDLFGGQTDLKHQTLRCVGDPDRRFQEDALRILRGLRFAAVYQFSIDSATADAIHRNKDGLKQIAGERIFSELKKLLHAASPGTHLLSYTDVLSVIFDTDYTQLASLHRLDKLDPIEAVRLAALLEPVGIDAIHRLKPDNTIKSQVRFLLSTKTLLIPQTLEETRQAVRRYGVEKLELWCKFLPEQTTAMQEHLSFILTNQLCCTTLELAISGSDLIALGIPEGKEIARHLSACLDAVIEGKIPNEKKALLNYLFL